MNSRRTLSSGKHLENSALRNSSKQILPNGIPTECLSANGSLTAISKCTNLNIQKGGRFVRHYFLWKSKIRNRVLCCRYRHFLLLRKVRRPFIRFNDAFSILDFFHIPVITPQHQL